MQLYILLRFNHTHSGDTMDESAPKVVSNVQVQGALEAFWLVDFSF